jgi:hypothetical protein
VKYDILTQSYIAQKKLKIVVVNLQCVVLIQESQHERDAIAKQIRKDHDNIKCPSKFDNI